jgi:hypothetical protein
MRSRDLFLPCLILARVPFPQKRTTAAASREAGLGREPPQPIFDPVTLEALEGGREASPHHHEDDPSRIGRV